MTDLERKYEIFGTRLALHLQRLYRGQCGRVAAQLELWQRYQTCAFIIQRAYREHVEWHEIITHTVLRNLQQSSHLSQNLQENMKAVEDSPAREKPKKEKGLGITKPLKNVPMPTLQPTSVNFARCLRNRATFDEKMSVWRAIIELRRGHPAMSAHICLKAMLESNGDLARAMVLMGDETYHLKNEGDVPPHLRSMFMPYLRDIDYLPKATSPDGSPGQRRDFDESFRSTVGRGNSGNTGNSIGLDGIRKLKAAETTRSFAPALDTSKEEDSGLDLTDVIAWTYFSKFFQGQLSGLIPPCQRPNPVQHVPSCKPISVAEIIETEERAAAAARPRAASPIITTGSPGFGRGRNSNSKARTFRGDSRSPSPTNKFNNTPTTIFGARQSSGRPGKLKRKLHGLRKGNGGGGHFDPGMTSEDVYSRKNADQALLTSLMQLQDEMDRTQRVA